MIAVIVLVVVNLVTLSFFISKGPGDQLGRKAMPREIIIEKLHFDDKQIAAYEKIILLHQQKIRSLDDSIRRSKNELYQLLRKESITEHLKDSLFLNLANYQKQIEQTHFIAIKSICRADQLNDFENLTEELSKIFSPQKKER